MRNAKNSQLLNSKLNEMNFRILMRIDKKELRPVQERRPHQIQFCDCALTALFTVSKPSNLPSKHARSLHSILTSAIFAYVVWNPAQMDLVLFKMIIDLHSAKLVLVSLVKAGFGW